MAAMWESLRREAHSASFNSRWRDCLSSRRAGVMRFRATWRFRRVSLARYTSPIPPLPRSSRIVNLPTFFPLRFRKEGAVDSGCRGCFAIGKLVSALGASLQFHSAKKKVLLGNLRDLAPAWRFDRIILPQAQIS